MTGKAKEMKKRRDGLSQEALELIAARFRVLAEPMRLRLLHTLGNEEMSVSELVDATGAGQANASKHLGLLLDAGLVARRKDGLNVYYRVADPSIFDLCEVVCNSLGERMIAHQKAIKNFRGK
jgi:ArsR family transcriptional regulator